MERRTERASEREMAGLCHKILNLQVIQDVIFTSHSASLERLSVFVETTKRECVCMREREHVTRFMQTWIERRRERRRERRSERERDREQERARKR